MGFRVLLISIEGKEAAAIHEEYSVVPTGQYEDIPESPVPGAVLPRGAYLLYTKDEIVPEDRVLARLSRGARLMALFPASAAESHRFAGVLRSRRSGFASGCRRLLQWV